MLEKTVDKMKLVFKVIGIEVIIKAYLTLGVIWLLAKMVDHSFTDDISIIYLTLAVILFPFSIALYNLLASFLFGNMMFINTVYIWFLLYVIKNAILFLFAPILGIVFIVIVLLTDSVNDWVVKYQAGKDSN